MPEILGENIKKETGTNPLAAQPQPEQPAPDYNKPVSDNPQGFHSDDPRHNYVGIGTNIPNYDAKQPYFGETGHNIPLTSTVPATGETVKDWLGRRLGMMGSLLEGFGSAFAMHLATSPITDHELKGVVKVAKAVGPPANADQLSKPMKVNFVGATSDPLAGLAPAFRHAIDSLPPDQKHHMEDLLAQRPTPETHPQEHNDWLNKVGAFLGSAPGFKQVTNLGQNIEALKHPSEKKGYLAVGGVVLGSLGGSALFGGAAAAGVSASAEAGISAAQQGVIDAATTLGGAVGASPWGNDAANAAYKPVSEAAAVVLQEAGAFSRLAANLIPVKGAGSGFKKSLQDWPSPQQVWDRAVSYGPGRSLALALGYDPAHGTGKYLSAATDATIRWMSDPQILGTKVLKGVELAETIPAGAAVPEARSGITRWAFEHAAVSPEKLVASDSGQALVSRISEAAKDGNANRLIERFPGMNSEVAKEIIRDPSEENISQALVGAMRGHQMAGVAPRVEADLQAIKDEKAQLTQQRAMTAGLVPGDPLAPRMAELDKEQSRLEGMLQDKPQTVFMRALPNDTFPSRMSDFIRRTSQPKTLGTEPYQMSFSDFKQDLETSTASSQPSAQARSFHLSEPGAAQEGISYTDDPKVLYQRWMDYAKGSGLDTYTPPSPLQRVAGIFSKHPFQQFTNITPTGPVSLVDKQAGRVTFNRLLRILRLPQYQIDQFTNDFMDASSHTEVMDVYTRALAAGKTELQRRGVPSSMAEHLTTFMREPGNTVYADIEGSPVEWARIKQEGERSVPFPQPIFEHQLTSYLPLPDVRGIQEALTMHGRWNNFVAGLADAATRHLQEATGPVEKTAGAVQSLESKALGLVGHWSNEEKMVGVWGQADRAMGLFTSALWVPLHILRVGTAAKIILIDDQAKLAAAGLPSLWHHPFEYLDNIFHHGEIQTPDEALINWGRSMVTRTVDRTGFVSYGKPGFEESWQTALQNLRASPTARYLAGHDEQETLAWLRTGGGKAQLELMRPVFERVGKTEEDWVNTLQEVLDSKATTDELRRAVVTGYLPKGVRLADTSAPGYLKTLSKDASPLRTLDVRELWRQNDQNHWQKFTGSLANHLLSRPTNELIRRPTFKAFYQKEMNYLESRGILGKPAQDLAKSYAVDQVHNLFYDIGQRSDFAATHRTLLPFFNAWQQNLDRWVNRIPAEAGPFGMGQAVLLKRAQILWDLGQQTGVFSKDKQSGQWVAKAFGLRIPLQGFANIGHLPGIGPGPALLAGPVVKKIPALQAILQTVQDNQETSLGPMWLDRAWVAATGKTPPWERLSADYQRHLYEMTAIHEMRDMDRKTGIMRTIAAMPEGPAKQKALDNFLAQAYDAARWDYAKRAIAGELLPVSPLKFWPSSDEMNTFYDSIKGMTGGEKSAAYENLYAEHPELRTYTISMAYSVTGEKQREDTRNAFWRNVFAGKENIYDAKTWSEVAAGFLQYDTARSIGREALANVGTTGPALASNFFRYSQALAKQSLVLSNLITPKQDGYNKDFADAWNRAVATAKKNKTAVPDFAEATALNAVKDLGTLQKILGPDETAVDPKALKTIKREIFNAFQLANFTTPADQLPAGPEQDLARYMQGPFTQYMNKIGTFFTASQNPDDKSAKMEAYREYRNSLKSVTLNGQTFPSPEAVLYAMKSPDEQKGVKYHWSSLPVAYLSNFQRKTLGLPVNKDEQSFWDQVNRDTNQLRAWAHTNNIPPSSKEYRDAKAQMNTTFENAATKYGLAREWALNSAKPFIRLAAYGQVNGPTWQAVTNAAVGIGNYFAGRVSGVDRLAWTNTFVDWLGRVVQADPSFANDLTQIQAASSQRIQGLTPSQFYEYLFLTGR